MTFLALQRVASFLLYLANFCTITQPSQILPNVGENVLRQSGLQEDVLDLHPRHEPVPVRVRLPEQRLKAQSKVKHLI